MGRVMASEEGVLLLESAARALADAFPDDVLRAGAFRASPPPGWHVVDALGLPLALAGVEAGGFGLDLREALAVVRLSGRLGLPIPLTETMVAHRLAEVARLASPAAGPATIAHAPDLRIEDHTDGWLVTGSVAHVPWGDAARTLLAVAQHGGRPMIVRLPREGWTTQSGTNLAGLPCDDLTVRAVIPRSAAAALPSGWDMQAILRAGAAIRAIQIAGAIDTVLRMTLDYLSQRKQFGRPLSQFQVLQHDTARLAEQAVAAAAAADLAVDAFATLDRLAIATAKARASEAAGQAAALTHQLHGAMGFTQELTLSHFTKLLWSWREEFGAETYWQEMLGEAALAMSADATWTFITAVDKYA